MPDACCWNEVHDTGFAYEWMKVRKLITKGLIKAMANKLLFNFVATEISPSHIFLTYKYTLES